MRLATTALLALIGNATAFAPTPITNTHRSITLSSLRANENQREYDIQKIFLSTLTAATLLSSPINAIAATSSPTAASVDPLSKEKSLVLSTKTTLESAQSALPTLESSFKKAQELVAKDVTAVKVAEQKVKETKRQLISVNDKLVEAKSRGGEKLVDVLAKDAENVKAKLAEAEKALNAAKTTESAAENDANYKQTKLADGQKALDSAKKASADAESKLASASKKQAELQKKADLKAKEDKKKADKKAKEDKKRATKKAKEDKKKAEKLAKKQKEQAKKQAQKAKKLQAKKEKELAKKEKEEAKKSKEMAKKQAAKQKELAKKDAEKAKALKQKELSSKKKEKTTAPKKDKPTKKKEELKATAAKPSATSKISVPNEKPLTGIKLNDDELKKLRDLDDRYAGKKTEAPAPAPETLVKGKGAGKIAAK